MTSRNIFGIVGGEIGEEALAIMKAKEDEKMPAIVVVATKKV
jgi:hypothetical protein